MRKTYFIKKKPYRRKKLKYDMGKRKENEEKIKI